MAQARDREARRTLVEMRPRPVNIMFGDNTLVPLFDEILKNCQKRPDSSKSEIDLIDQKPSKPCRARQNPSKPVRTRQNPVEIVKNRRKSETQRYSRFLSCERERGREEERERRDRERGEREEREEREEGEEGAVECDVTRWSAV